MSQFLSLLTSDPAVPGGPGGPDCPWVPCETKEIKDGRKTLVNTVFSISIPTPLFVPITPVDTATLLQPILTCSSDRSPYKRTRRLMWVCRVLIQTLGQTSKKKFYAVKKEGMLAVKNQRSFSYSAYFANFKVLYLLAKASVLCALC